MDRNKIIVGARTKGQWETQVNHTIYRKSDGKKIASLWGDTSQEQEGNAQLIVKSPAMRSTILTIIKELTQAQADGRELTIYEAGILRTLQGLGVK